MLKVTQKCGLQLLLVRGVAGMCMISKPTSSFFPILWRTFSPYCRSWPQAPPLNSMLFLTALALWMVLVQLPETSRELIKPSNCWYPCLQNSPRAAPSLLHFNFLDDGFPTLSPHQWSLDVLTFDFCTAQGCIWWLLYSESQRMQ